MALLLVYTRNVSVRNLDHSEFLALDIVYIITASVILNSLQNRFIRTSKEVPETPENQKNASYALTVNTCIYSSRKYSSQTACKSGNCLVAKLSETYLEPSL